MYLVKKNTPAHNRWLMPWMNFPRVFDEDFFTDSSTDLDMWEDDKAVHVKVAVPGIKEDDLDIQIESGVLTVRGASSVDEEEKKGKKKVYSSSMKSSYHYSTTLPSDVDVSKVEAVLEHGVLTVSIEKSKKAKPKKIAVKTKSKKKK